MLAKTRSFDNFEETLKHWAKWCLNCSDPYLGYPRTASFATLYCNRSDLSQKRSDFMACDALAEHVEDLIRILSQQQPQLATAVRLRYVSREDQRQCAKRLKIVIRVG